jgi:uncharacterized protein
LKKIQFSGAWALVTGASSGIGAEFARQLAHRGAHLILTARSEERLRRLADDLAKVNGVQTRVVVADLAATGGIDQLLAGVRAIGVPVEHVISNAGFGTVGPLTTSDAHAQREMVRVNVEAVTALAQHFVPELVRLGRGGLIQVASTAAYQPTPYMATYGATKAFVLNFSLALAEELHASGVRVLALCPGPVPTGFQRTAGIPKNSLIRLTKVEAPAVVEAALDGYLDGKRVVIPGTLNGFQAAAVKLLPSAIVTRAARWTMRSLGRS